MTWRIEPAHKIGTRHVVAISGTRQNVAAGAGWVQAVVQKCFLAVIIIDGDAITLLDVKGAQIPVTDFERRFPNAIAQATTTASKGESGIAK